MEVERQWPENRLIGTPDATDRGDRLHLEHTSLPTEGNLLQTVSGLKHRGRPPKDITGQRFGKLTAVKLVGRNTYGKALWYCECDCGGTIVTALPNLDNGETRSCGCLYVKDIAGQRFGKLMALYPTKERRSKYTVWHCRCDCGNEVDVPSMYLYRGDRKTCTKCGDLERGRKSLPDTAQ